MSGTDTSLLELCNLIRSDPAFSIAVLKVANLPLVAFSKNVNSVLQASVLLGFLRLRRVVITVGLRAYFENSFSLLIRSCWRHMYRLRDHCRAQRQVELAGLRLRLYGGHSARYRERRSGHVYATRIRSRARARSGPTRGSSPCGTRIMRNRPLRGGAFPGGYMDSPRRLS